jgi:fatty acid desaturase
MPDENDLERLRADLTRALRFADISRRAASDLEHRLNRAVRLNQRLRTWNLISMTACTVAWVALFIAVGNGWGK